MRTLLHVFCAVVFLALGAQASQARAVFGSSTEAIFISSTMLPDQNGVPNALCLRTNTFRLFSIPFYRSSQGATLSPATCQVDKLTPVSLEQMDNGIPGVRPWVLAKAGNLAPLHILQGFWGWALLPFLLIPIWVARAFARQETAGREVLLQMVDPYTQTLCEMLGFVAGADGRLNRQRFARIRAIVTDKTGEEVSQQEVIELARPAEGPLNEVDLDGIGEKLSRQQRINVADAVQRMICEADNAGPDLDAFASRLFDALGIPNAEPQVEDRYDTMPRGYYASASPAE